MLSFSIITLNLLTLIFLSRLHQAPNLFLPLIYLTLTTLSISPILYPFPKNEIFGYSTLMLMIVFNFLGSVSTSLAKSPKDGPLTLFPLALDIFTPVSPRSLPKSKKFNFFVPILRIILFNFGTSVSYYLHNVIAASCDNIFAYYLVRWFSTLIHAYSAMEMVYGILNLAYGVIGSSLTERFQHRNPILASSISDFWSRWNGCTRYCLVRAFYLPFRRVSEIFSVLFTFFGSAVLHGFPMWLGTKEWICFWGPIAFFLLNGVFVMVDKMIWGKKECLMRRISGWLAFLVISPLYMEPIISMFQDTRVPLLVRLD